MPFKLHLGPDSPDNTGVLWVRLMTSDGNIHLRFPHCGSHGLRIRDVGNGLTFQISEFTGVSELPLDWRGSIRCRGSNGPWSFGESAPEIPQDQVQALNSYLKEALCLV
jgi:hypothetical protein